eukprot:MONOS_289.1-p1 / transcript=MONOS_289.1 / gene=MONOS_289 / organism=Monocercomonoides_exilis_PA203 / gene_product=Brefeldin A-inhibited guanine nucleotide-exchange protein 2 / transcript_product=Brefeldin A-inhibited guanine nucleotide-exchange protein 2 / location=Mono_scaffold00005:16307-25040(-) / protein_length=2717 / sequence_SO=supercontig / SO=protein_coding / is_pseudo=false
MSNSAAILDAFDNFIQVTSSLKHSDVCSQASHIKEIDQPQVTESILNIIHKMAEFGFLKGETDSPKDTESLSLNSVIDIVCSQKFSTTKDIQLLVIKILSMIVTSPYCVIHFQAFKEIIRTLLQFYLSAEYSIIRNSSSGVLQQLCNYFVQRIQTASGASFADFKTNINDVQANSPSGSSERSAAATAMKSQLVQDAVDMITYLCSLISLNQKEDNSNDPSATQSVKSPQPSQTPTDVQQITLALQCLLNITSKSGTILTRHRRLRNTIKNTLLQTILTAAGASKSHVFTITITLFISLLRLFPSFCITTQSDLFPIIEDDKLTSSETSQNEETKLNPSTQTEMQVDEQSKRLAESPSPSMLPSAASSPTPSPSPSPSATLSPGTSAGSSSLRVIISSIFSLIIHTLSSSEESLVSDRIALLSALSPLFSDAVLLLLLFLRYDSSIHRINILQRFASMLCSHLTHSDRYASIIGGGNISSSTSSSSSSSSPSSSSSSASSQSSSSASSQSLQQSQLPEAKLPPPVASSANTSSQQLFELWCLQSVASMCIALSEWRDARSDGFSSETWENLEKADKAALKAMKSRWTKKRQLRTAKETAEVEEIKESGREDAEDVKDALMRHFVEFGSLPRDLINSYFEVKSTSRNSDYNNTSSDAILSDPTVNPPFYPFSLNEIIQTKSLLTHAVSLFNQSPKSCQRFFIRHQLLPSSPAAFAHFILLHDKLSKSRIGEFFGENDPFALSVLKEFCALLRFSGLKLDAAMSLFLSQFRIPGEGQKICRIIEVFGEQYHEANPGIFPDADCAFRTSYSAVMLHSIAHSGRMELISKELFLRQNEENGVSEEYLNELYDRIVGVEMRVVDDDDERVRMAVEDERRIMSRGQFTKVQRERAEEERKLMASLLQRQVEIEQKKDERCEENEGEGEDGEEEESDEDEMIIHHLTDSASPNNSPVHRQTHSQLSPLSLPNDEVMSPTTLSFNPITQGSSSDGTSIALVPVSQAQNVDVSFAASGASPIPFASPQQAKVMLSGIVLPSLFHLRLLLKSILPSFVPALSAVLSHSSSTDAIRTAILALRHCLHLSSRFSLSFHTASLVCALAPLSVLCSTHRIIEGSHLLSFRSLLAAVSPDREGNYLKEEWLVVVAAAARLSRMQSVMKRSDDRLVSGKGMLMLMDDLGNQKGGDEYGDGDDDEENEEEEDDSMNMSNLNSDSSILNEMHPEERAISEAVRRRENEELRKEREREKAEQKKREKEQKENDEDDYDLFGNLSSESESECAQDATRTREGASATGLITSRNATNLLLHQQRSPSSHSLYRILTGNRRVTRSSLLFYSVVSPCLLPFDSIVLADSSDDLALQIAVLKHNLKFCSASLLASEFDVVFSSTPSLSADSFASFVHSLLFLASLDLASPARPPPSAVPLFAVQKLLDVVEFNLYRGVRKFWAKLIPSLLRTLRDIVNMVTEAHLASYSVNALIILIFAFIDRIDEEDKEKKKKDLSVETPNSISYSTFEQERRESKADPNADEREWYSYPFCLPAGKDPTSDTKTANEPEPEDESADIPHPVVTPYSSENLQFSLFTPLLEIVASDNNSAISSQQKPQKVASSSSVADILAHPVSTFVKFSSPSPFTQTLAYQIDELFERFSRRRLSENELPVKSLYRHTSSHHKPLHRIPRRVSPTPFSSSASSSSASSSQLVHKRSSKEDSTPHIFTSLLRSSKNLTLSSSNTPPSHLTLTPVQSTSFASLSSASSLPLEGHSTSNSTAYPMFGSQEYTLSPSHPFASPSISYSYTPPVAATAAEAPPPSPIDIAVQQFLLTTHTRECTLQSIDLLVSSRFHLLTVGWQSVFHVLALLASSDRLLAASLSSELNESSTKNSNSTSDKALDNKYSQNNDGSSRVSLSKLQAQTLTQTDPNSPSTLASSLSSASALVETALRVFHSIFIDRLVFWMPFALHQAVAAASAFTASSAPLPLAEECVQVGAHIIQLLAGDAAIPFADEARKIEEGETPDSVSVSTENEESSQEKPSSREASIENIAISRARVILSHVKVYDDAHLHSLWLPCIASPALFLDDPRPTIRDRALNVTSFILINYGHLFTCSFWEEIQRIVLTPLILAITAHIASLAELNSSMQEEISSKPKVQKLDAQQGSFPEEFEDAEATIEWVRVTLPFALQTLSAVLMKHWSILSASNQSAQEKSDEKSPQSSSLFTSVIGLMKTIISCGCEEASEIGLNSLKDLISAVGDKMTPDQWMEIAGVIENIVWTTLPMELMVWKCKCDADATLDSENDDSLMPSPFSLQDEDTKKQTAKDQFMNASQNPFSSQRTRLDPFDLTKVKWKSRVQLNMMRCITSIVEQQLTTIPPAALRSFFRTVSASLSFARVFNHNYPPRILLRLLVPAFENTTPSLLSLEIDASLSLITILNRIICAPSSLEPESDSTQFDSPSPAKSEHSKKADSSSKDIEELKNEALSMLIGEALFSLTDFIMLNGLYIRTANPAHFHTAFQQLTAAEQKKVNEVTEWMNERAKLRKVQGIHIVSTTSQPFFHLTHLSPLLPEENETQPSNPTEGLKDVLNGNIPRWDAESVIASLTTTFLKDLSASVYVMSPESDLTTIPSSFISITPTIAVDPALIARTSDIPQYSVLVTNVIRFMNSLPSSMVDPYLMDILPLLVLLIESESPQLRNQIACFISSHLSHLHSSQQSHLASLLSHHLFQPSQNKDKGASS